MMPGVNPTTPRTHTCTTKHLLINMDFYNFWKTSAQIWEMSFVGKTDVSIETIQSSYPALGIVNDNNLMINSVNILDNFLLSTIFSNLMIDRLINCLLPITEVCVNSYVVLTSFDVFKTENAIESGANLEHYVSDMCDIGKSTNVCKMSACFTSIHLLF